MLNDRSSLLSFLESRRSAKPRELVGPGPSGAELDRILAIAARTPDHGKLTPWRFVVIADDQRNAFEALLLRALEAENPGANDAHRQKECEFAHYAGQLVVLLAAITPEHKIPVWEQELSVGAAGMNLMLGAQALGFDVGWMTGWRTYSNTVQASLCEPGERIAGFIFIGHAGRQLEERPRPPLPEVVRRWRAPTN